MLFQAFLYFPDNQPEMNDCDVDAKCMCTCASLCMICMSMHVHVYVYSKTLCIHTFDDFAIIFG